MDRGPGEGAEPERDTNVVISIVGTNDLHGQLEALPVLGGHLDILRRVRAEDGGVVLVDAGDMWQGTLASNLEEGAAVVAAYEILRYDAVAIGNHEFDYGPVGPAATPGLNADGTPAEDPRGALRARAASASFAFLSANIVDSETLRRPDWDNVVARATVEVAGIPLGFVGVTSIDTPETTLSANFVGLEMLPLADAVAEHAAQLRAEGVAAVIVVAHAGGRCREFDDPDDLSSCDPQQEIFELVEALPASTIDVIVAGHTHAGIAHRHGGVAIIESFSHGRAFGRVDLVVDREHGRLLDAHIFAPRMLCENGRGDTCESEPYEGQTVVSDERVASTIAPALARAAERMNERLGVTVATPMWRAYDRESPLGNLVADLMRESSDADVAMTNGGGLRADLPAGPLTYGALYEALPFDNRLARLEMRAGALERIIAGNLGKQRSILSISGVRARARCRGDQVVVQLFDEKGRRIPQRRILRVVTSDFLATGGDGAFSAVLEDKDVTFEEERALRDVLAELLRRRGGTLRADGVFDPARRRIDYIGERPIMCSAGE